MRKYTDCRQALRDAVRAAPSVIGWAKARPGYWFLYHPTKPPTDMDFEPEIVCLARGVILPLSENGERVLR
jgi:hypothetical protein